MARIARLLRHDGLDGRRRPYGQIVIIRLAFDNRFHAGRGSHADRLGLHAHRLRPARRGLRPARRGLHTHRLVGGEVDAPDLDTGDGGFHSGGAGAVGFDAWGDDRLDLGGLDLGWLDHGRGVQQVG